MLVIPRQSAVWQRALWLAPAAQWHRPSPARSVSINIAADGSYTYTVNNSNAAVQALRTTSDTLQDVFTYTMRDTAGLTSTTQITVTIQGANDAPTDITAGALTIAENSANGSAIGTASGVDIDAADTFTYSLTNNAGGRFAIDSSTGAITVANSALINTKQPPRTQSPFESWMLAG